MNKCSRDRMLEKIEEGVLDPNHVVLMFCKWNTQDDIVDMCHANGIELWEDEEEEEEE